MGECFLIEKTVLNFDYQLKVRQVLLRPKQSVQNGLGQSTVLENLYDKLKISIVLL